ncbi:unnamed protein product [Boreogadus saida]
MAAENTHFASTPRCSPASLRSNRRPQTDHTGATRIGRRGPLLQHSPATPPQGTSKGLRARPSDGALSSTEPGLISGEPDRVKPSITGQL